MGSSPVLCLSYISRLKHIFGSQRLAQQLLGGCHVWFDPAWLLYSRSAASEMVSLQWDATRRHSFGHEATKFLTQTAGPF